MKEMIDSGLSYGELLALLRKDLQLDPSSVGAQWSVDQLNAAIAPPRGRTNALGIAQVIPNTGAAVLTGTVTAAMCKNGMVPATNGFRVPISGSYRVFGHATITPAVGQGGYTQIFLLQNALQTANGIGTAIGSAAGFTSPALLDVLPALAGDIFTVSISNQTGVALTVNASLLTVEYAGQ